jgi:hypothetical protein
MEDKKKKKSIAAKEPDPIVEESTLENSAEKNKGGKKELRKFNHFFANNHLL